MVEYFLARLSSGRPACRIAKGAMQHLLAYDWPGNVRELRNVLERGMILSEGGIISEQALPRELVESGALPPTRTVRPTRLSRWKSATSGRSSWPSRAIACRRPRCWISRKTLYRKLKDYAIQ